MAGGESSSAVRAVVGREGRVGAEARHVLLEGRAAVVVAREAREARGESGDGAEGQERDAESVAQHGGPPGSDAVGVVVAVGEAPEEVEAAVEQVGEDASLVFVEGLVDLVERLDDGLLR